MKAMKPVKHFLLVYNRATAELISCQDFGEDGAGALTARFAAEMKERAKPDVEVIVLSADSTATLMRTHSRYFKTMSELTGDFSAKVAS